MILTRFGALNLPKNAQFCLCRNLTSVRFAAGLRPAYVRHAPGLGPDFGHPICNIPQLFDYANLVGIDQVDGGEGAQFGQKWMGLLNTRISNLAPTATQRTAQES